MIDNKSRSLSNDFSPHYRLSMRFDDGKAPSRVSSRLIDVLPTNKKSLPNPKENWEVQRERELNVDTDDPQLNKFLKYGNRRDYNKWSPP